MAEKITSESQTKFGKLKAKILEKIYGDPTSDMKLIYITGTSGTVEVANFVHEILRCAGHPVSILAQEEPIKITKLRKFLNISWKGGSNYAIVTAPAESLKKDVFYGLPIHIAALTNTETTQNQESTNADQPTQNPDHTAPTDTPAESILFQLNPDFVILNHDDTRYADFADYAGSQGTITYGTDRFSNVRILNSKLYKLGAEATLTIGNSNFTVASFLNTAESVSYMAAATAIADALHVIPDKIAEGIANYEPKDTNTPTE